MVTLRLSNVQQSESHLSGLLNGRTRAFVLHLSLMLSLSSFKPTTYVPRYPRWMIGRPLLIATSALASLGDAMFGYSQGTIAANQVQPSFIKRMFGKDVTMEQIQTSETGVDPFIVGA